MVTLEEAIKGGEELVREERKEADNLLNKGFNDLAKMKSVQADNHEQLTEWLKELMAYRLAEASVTD